MSKRVPNTAAERLFVKYEPLVKHYAAKLFHTQRIGMEKEDIEQELRLKLYQIILAYGRSLDHFHETGQRKPVPLVFYIQRSLDNHINDFIKDIESDASKLFASNILVEGYDYSSFSNDVVNFDWSGYQLLVNEFDLLGNLSGDQKRLIYLYYKGFPTNKLKKIFKHRIKSADVEKVISEHHNFLNENLELFKRENEQEFFVTTFIED